MATLFAIVNVFSQNNKYDSFSVPIKVKPGAQLSKPVGSDISPNRLVTCERPDVHIFPSNVPQSEVHISINKTNNQSLLVSSNTFPIGNSFQGSYWSNNSGATWQGADILPNNAFGRGDPSTAYDAQGRGYIATMAPNATDNPNGYFIQRTDNNGTTWQPQVNATGVIPGFDKEMIAADDVPTSPFANNLYCTWTVFGAATTVQFNRSTNGCNTFTNPIILRNGFGQGANVQTGPNGEVYVCWADYTNGQLPAQGLGFTRSLDGGANFNAAVVAFNYAGIRVGNGEKPDFNNTRVNDFPAMAVDKSNGARRGRIYVVYSERENGNGRSIVRLRWSDNRGDTWSASTTVSIPTARQSWMPWVSVDDTNGNVFVTYFCMENQNNFNTNTFVAASVNGFTTFQNRVVSDVAHVTFRIPQFGGGYAGDYIGITANGGRSFAAWMDDRNGVWQNYVSEVRAADIEFNGNSLLCSGTNTYTLTGVPAGATVNWQQPTPTGIVNMSTSGNTANLTRTSNGIITLSAEVIDNGCSYGFFTMQITVGVPPVPTIQYVTYYGNEVGLTALLIPDATYNRYEGGVLTEAGGGNTYLTTVPCNTTKFIQVEAVNACGTSIKAGKGVSVKCSTGGAYSLAPNPASSNLTISVNESVDKTSAQTPTEIQEVRITDKSGNLKTINKYPKGTKSVNINTISLKSDVYFVQIFNGKEWDSQQLIIQH